MLGLGNLFVRPVNSFACKNIQTETQFDRHLALSLLLRIRPCPIHSQRCVFSAARLFITFFCLNRNGNEIASRVAFRPEEGKSSA